ncbi:MAG: helix-turn-helix transcriptional regulator [Oscillospiraceae bacterium]|nr:helix-turn-helix transcriptional regulator [Oscillospiraceae bacterium]
MAPIPLNGKNVLYRILNSLGKLWGSGNNLSFSYIRPNRLAYILPLSIILTLCDQRNTYMTPTEVFLGSDKSTIAFAAYAVGTIFVLFFIMKHLIGGIKSLAAIAAISFAVWIALPDSDIRNAVMLVFQFAIGGSAIYATYAHVFVLNNSERMFSVLFATFNYGFSVFAQQNGINNVFLAVIYPGALVLVLLVCACMFKAVAFPDTSPEKSIEPPKGIYIVLLCPLAFFLLDVFGEAIVNRGPGDASLRGTGAMLAVLIAVIVHFGLRRGVWFLLSFFLILATVGFMLLAFPVSARLSSVGNFLFGIGDGFGNILVFYIVGLLKKYRNDKFFWRITLATVCSMLFAIVVLDVTVRLAENYLGIVAVALAVTCLFLFQALSPKMQRSVFGSDWIDDFVRPDMSYIIMEKFDTMTMLEPGAAGADDAEGAADADAGRFKGLKLSPREEEVAMLLLSGLSLRQISAEIGIAESTAYGYSGTLYKKLGINSRAELFARFGVRAVAVVGEAMGGGNSGDGVNGVNGGDDGSDENFRGEAL